MTRKIETEELARRVAEGETLSAIARELGISGAALSQQLSRAGIKGPGRVRRVPPDDTFRVVARVASTAVMREMFGVTRMTITKHCRRLGILPRPRLDPVSKREVKEAVAEIRRLKPDGAKEIIDALKKIKTMI